MSDYKYLNTVASRFINNKHTMLDEYQHFMDQQFYNTTDWFTIQEEVDTDTAIDIDVRLNTIHDEKGTKLSDDYRKIIFRELDHDRGLGKKYFFDNSTWLTINYDLYGKPTASVVVHKCRANLKWIDPNTGATYLEPCAIEKAQDSSVKAGYNANIILPMGDVVVVVQNNAHTRTIQYNQRFYFDSRTVYKVTSISLPQNNPTNGEAPLFYYGLTKDFVNSGVDDVPNNLANVNEYIYSIVINQGSFNQTVGYTGTLSVTCKLNGAITTRNIVWSSSDSSVVSIDKNGVINCLKIGEAQISASIENNENVIDTINIAVESVPTDISEIVITPSQNYILEGSRITFTVYNYTNNVVTTDGFTLTASGVPESHYIITKIDANTFNVDNIEKYNGGLLLLTFTDTTTDVIKSISVKLKGVF